MLTNVWTCLENVLLFVWTAVGHVLGMLDNCWTTCGHVGQPLNRVGTLLDTLDTFGHVQTTVGHLGQLWEKLNNCWTSFNLLDICGQRVLDMFGKLLVIRLDNFWTSKTTFGSVEQLLDNMRTCWTTFKQVWNTFGHAGQHSDMFAQLLDILDKCWTCFWTFVVTNGNLWTTCFGHVWTIV